MNRQELKIVTKNIPFPYEIKDKPQGSGYLVINDRSVWLWIQGKDAWEINYSHGAWRAVNVGEWYKKEIEKLENMK